MQATHITPVKSLITLLLVVCTLLGLTAARPAQAALNLTWYDCYVNLHYSSGSNKTAFLQVLTQDNAGNFTGDMYIGSTTYTVKGTLTYWGIWLGNPWYTFTMDANYSSLGSGTSMHFSGWVRDNGGANITLGWGNFTWSSWFWYYFASGSGTFDGYGFVPPR